MEAEIMVNPRLLVERLQKAMNDHNIEAFVDCFDSLYFGEEPAYPERAFRGRERIRMEWTAMFQRVPDFRASIVRCHGDESTVWAEWHWRGTDSGQSRFEMRGVTVLGIRDNRFVWGRLYMQPMREPGGGMKPFAG